LGIFSHEQENEEVTLLVELSYLLSLWSRTCSYCTVYLSSSLLILIDVYSNVNAMYSICCLFICLLLCFFSNLLSPIFRLTP
jgi:hypothetical protein